MQDVSEPRFLSDQAALASEIAGRKKSERLIVAIVGAPGSGKSTLSDQLRDRLIAWHGVTCEVVPMDGFHYDNAILDQMGLRARKGSPQTFDVDGLDNLLERLRVHPSNDVAVPVFDREIDLSRASARVIGNDVDVLLVEGNYLLLEQKPWDELRKHFDLTVKIRSERKVLEQRLMQRWLDLGMSEKASRTKVESNDLLNADTIETLSAAADILYG